MPVRSVRLCAVVVVLSASRAFAAGFEIPELGAGPIAQGGTGAARFGTAYSLLQNPAGMAWNEGLDVRLDARVLSHAVTFQRTGGDADQFFGVENTGGASISPFLGVSYRPKTLAGGNLSFGLALFPPAGVSHYAYPDPSVLVEEGAGAADVKAAAPQRYTLIESNTLILFPTLSVAYRFLNDFAIGISGQATYADIGLKQSIAAIGGDENTDADAAIDARFKSGIIPTVVVGAGWEATPELHVGASFRPSITVDATGPFKVILPGFAAGLGYSVDDSKDSDLRMYLPSKANLGVSYRKNKILGSLDLVYEGWSVAKQFELKPNVVITKPDGSKQTMAREASCDCVALVKNWKDSFGARLGGGYELLPPSDGLGLTVNAGVLYETNAIPAEKQQIDYVTGDRLGGGAGVTASFGGFSLTVSGMAYAPVTIEVTNSTVARAAAEPETPVIIGNGTYTSGIWMLGVGLAYSTPAEAK